MFQGEEIAGEGPELGELWVVKVVGNQAGGDRMLGYSRETRRN